MKDLIMFSIALIGLVGSMISMFLDKIVPCIILFVIGLTAYLFWGATND